MINQLQRGDEPALLPCRRSGFLRRPYIQLPPAAIGVLEPLDPAGADAQLIQVIGVDQHGNRCWVRRWPLARHGSPVFELPRGQVQEPLPHRPLPVGRRVG